MKKILFAALFLIPLFTFAQDEKEVVAAVEKMRTALLAEDAATLKSLTSEDLTYGHSSGGMENQDQFLAVFESKKTDYQKWDISNLSIAFHGKEMAMVRHNVIAEFFADSKVTTLNLGVLMVWVKEKGDWKLLARQAFRIPQAQ